MLQIIQQRMQQKDREDGVALLTLIGVSVIIFIMMATITTSTTLSVFSTNMQLSQEQARHNAESAIELAEKSYESSITYQGFNEEFNKDTRDLCQGYSNSHYSFTFYRVTNNTEKPPTSVDAPGVLANECAHPDDKWYMIKATGYGNNNAESELVRTYKKFDYDNKMYLSNNVISADTLQINGDNVQIDAAQGITMMPSINAMSSVECSNGSTGQNRIAAHIHAKNIAAQSADCVFEGDIITEENTSTELNHQGDICVENDASHDASHLSYDGIHCVEGPTSILTLTRHFAINLFEQYKPDNVEVKTFASCGELNQDNAQALRAAIERKPGYNQPSHYVVDVRNCDTADTSLSGNTYTVYSDIILLVNPNSQLRDITIQNEHHTGTLSIYGIQNTGAVANTAMILRNVQYVGGAAGAISSMTQESLEIHNSTINGWVHNGVIGSSVILSGDTQVNMYPVSVMMKNAKYSTEQLYDEYTYHTPSVRVH